MGCLPGPSSTSHHEPASRPPPCRPPLPQLSHLSLMVPLLSLAPPLGLQGPSPSLHPECCLASHTPLKAGQWPAAPSCLWALRTESRTWASFLGTPPLAPPAALLPVLIDDLPTGLPACVHGSPSPGCSSLPLTRPGFHVLSARFRPAQERVLPHSVPLRSSLARESLHRQRPTAAQLERQNVDATSMRPVSGWKLRAGSSVVTRH